MKNYTKSNFRSFRKVFLLGCLLMAVKTGYTQTDSSQPAAQEQAEKPKPKPVKNTFESIWILDNQTVMVPIHKTLQLDFMHRFGTWNNGYQDFFGLFGGINIRLGVSYVPIEKLLVGVAFTEYNLTW